MKIARLVYFVLLIVTGVFLIAYVDSLSLLLFIVALALPIFMFLIVLLARVLTRITVDLESNLVTKGQPAILRLHIKNRSFIALPGLRARVSYSGAFSDEEERTEVTFPLHAFTNQTAFCHINSQHLGVVKVKIKDVLLHDYFHLFTFKIKVNQEHEITFLPEIIPIEMGFRPNTLLGVDSDEFSKTKKGDDPSEVFAIRDYAGGDKLNRIHWKLSSKQDSLLVKDYSLPINNSIVILVELANRDGQGTLDDIDDIITSAVAISARLCEAELTHRICWYDKKTNQFYNEEVKAIEDMFTALGLMFASGISDESSSMVFFKNERMICSHVAYLTCMDELQILDDLKEMSFGTFYSIFNVDAKGAREVDGEAPGGMQYVPIKNGKIADALNGVNL